MNFGGIRLSISLSQKNFCLESTIPGSHTPRPQHSSSSTAAINSTPTCTRCSSIIARLLSPTARVSYSCASPRTFSRRLASGLVWSSLEKQKIDFLSPSFSTGYSVQLNRQHSQLQSARRCANALVVCHCSPDMRFSLAQRRLTNQAGVTSVRWGVGVILSRAAARMEWHRMVRLQSRAYCEYSLRASSSSFISSQQLTAKMTTMARAKTKVRTTCLVRYWWPSCSWVMWRWILPQWWDQRLLRLGALRTSSISSGMGMMRLRAVTISLIISESRQRKGESTTRLTRLKLQTRSSRPTTSRPRSSRPNTRSTSRVGDRCSTLRYSSWSPPWMSKILQFRRAGSPLYLRIRQAIVYCYLKPSQKNSRKERQAELKSYTRAKQVLLSEALVPSKYWCAGQVSLSTALVRELILLALSRLRARSQALLPASEPAMSSAAVSRVMASIREVLKQDSKSLQQSFEKDTCLRPTQKQPHSNSSRARIRPIPDHFVAVKTQGACSFSPNQYSALLRPQQGSSGWTDSPTAARGRSRVFSRPSSLTLSRTRVCSKNLRFQMRLTLRRTDLAFSLDSSSFRLTLRVRPFCPSSCFAREEMKMLAPISLLSRRLPAPPPSMNPSLEIPKYSAHLRLTPYTVSSQREARRYSMSPCSYQSNASSFTKPAICSPSTMRGTTLDMTVAGVMQFSLLRTTRLRSSKEYFSALFSTKAWMIPSWRSATTFGMMRLTDCPTSSFFWKPSRCTSLLQLVMVPVSAWLPEMMTTMVSEFSPYLLCVTSQMFSFWIRLVRSAMRARLSRWFPFLSLPCAVLRQLPYSRSRQQLLRFMRLSPSNSSSSCLQSETTLRTAACTFSALGLLSATSFQKLMCSTTAVSRVSSKASSLNWNYMNLCAGTTLLLSLLSIISEMSLLRLNTAMCSGAVTASSFAFSTQNSALNLFSRHSSCTSACSISTPKHTLCVAAYSSICRSTNLYHRRRGESIQRPWHSQPCTWHFRLCASMYRCRRYLLIVNLSLLRMLSTSTCMWPYTVEGPTSPRSSRELRALRKLQRDSIDPATMTASRKADAAGNCPEQKANVQNIEVQMQRSAQKLQAFSTSQSKGLSQSRKSRVLMMRRGRLRGTKVPKWVRPGSSTWYRTQKTLRSMRLSSQEKLTPAKGMRLNGFWLIVKSQQRTVWTSSSPPVRTPRPSQGCDGNPQDGDGEESLEAEQEEGVETVEDLPEEIVELAGGGAEEVEEDGEEEGEEHEEEGDVEQGGLCVVGTEGHDVDDALEVEGEGAVWTRDEGGLLEEGGDLEGLDEEGEREGEAGEPAVLQLAVEQPDEEGPRPIKSAHSFQQYAMYCDTIVFTWLLISRFILRQVQARYRHISAPSSATPPAAAASTNHRKLNPLDRYGSCTKGMHFFVGLTRLLHSSQQMSPASSSPRQVTLLTTAPGRKVTPALKMLSRQPSITVELVLDFSASTNFSTLSLWEEESWSTAHSSLFLRISQLLSTLRMNQKKELGSCWNRKCSSSSSSSRSAPWSLVRQNPARQLRFSLRKSLTSSLSKASQLSCRSSLPRRSAKKGPKSLTRQQVSRLLLSRNRSSRTRSLREVSNSTLAFISSSRRTVAPFFLVMSSAGMFTLQPSPSDTITTEFSSSNSLLFTMTMPLNPAFSATMALCTKVQPPRSATTQRPPPTTSASASSQRASDRFSLRAVTRSTVTFLPQGMCPKLAREQVRPSGKASARDSGARKVNLEQAVQKRSIINQYHFDSSVSSSASPLSSSPSSSPQPSACSSSPPTTSRTSSWVSLNRSPIDCVPSSTTTTERPSSSNRPAKQGPADEVTPVLMPQQPLSPRSLLVLVQSTSLRRPVRWFIICAECSRAETILRNRGLRSATAQKTARSVEVEQARWFMSPWGLARKVFSSRSSLARRFTCCMKYLTKLRLGGSLPACVFLRLICLWMTSPKNQARATAASLPEGSIIPNSRSWTESTSPGCSPAEVPLELLALSETRTGASRGMLCLRTSSRQQQQVNILVSEATSLHLESLLRSRGTRSVSSTVQLSAVTRPLDPCWAVLPRLLRFSWQNCCASRSKLSRLLARLSLDQRIQEEALRRLSYSGFGGATLVSHCSLSLRREDRRGLASLSTLDLGMESGRGQWVSWVAVSCILRRSSAACGQVSSPIARIERGRTRCSLRSVAVSDGIINNTMATLASCQRLLVRALARMYPNAGRAALVPDEYRTPAHAVVLFSAATPLADQVLPQIFPGFTKLTNPPQDPEALANEASQVVNLSRGCLVDNVFKSKEEARQFDETTQGPNLVLSLRGKGEKCSLPEEVAEYYRTRGLLLECEWDQSGCQTQQLQELQSRVLCAYKL